jgi:hypothetical protein
VLPVGERSPVIAGPEKALCVGSFDMYELVLGLHYRLCLNARRSQIALPSKRLGFISKS